MINFCKLANDVKVFGQQSK